MVSVYLGYNVSFSFYAQHQLESLRVEDSMLEELKQANPTKSDGELRGVLGLLPVLGR